MDSDFIKGMENKQAVQTMEIMANAKMSVVEKYKRFAIYHDLVHHIISLKTTFKKDWIEINQLADRIIWEKENVYKP